jgi:hypothetical protein
MKALIHPVTGQSVKMGRVESTDEEWAQPRLMLATYLDSAILPKPSPGPLSRYNNPTIIPVGKQMYGNDHYGDCSIAAKGKAIGSWKGLANPPAAIFQTSQILADYFRLTGGQDTGLSLLQVLKDWRDNGVNPTLGAANRIAGFATVDASIRAHVEIGIDFFFGLYLGVSLPDGWITPMPSASGFVWQLAGAPNPQNGHCIWAVDYDAEGVIVWTWGMGGRINWPAFMEYFVRMHGGEAHVIFSQEIFNTTTEKTPIGLDLKLMESDWRAMGGGALAIAA